MSQLLLLGGPPGVGKSTVLKELSQQGVACLDADNISPPQQAVAQQTAIADVISAARQALGTAPSLVLAWVFATPQPYQPFLEEFSGIKLQQLYLVCSDRALSDRLIHRGDRQLIPYARDRLNLIQQLPFARLDTTTKTHEHIASILISKYGLGLNH